jgi:hypothetical protein
MTTRDMTRLPAASPLDRFAATDAAHAAQIVKELDHIVGDSRRKSPLRRALSGIRGGFANWLEGLVPPASPQAGSEPPPEIRFPFF